MGTPGGVVASKSMTMKVVSQNAGSRVSCVGLNQPQEKEQPRLPHSYLRGLIPALGRGHWAGTHGEVSSRVLGPGLVCAGIIAIALAER